MKIENARPGGQLFLGRRGENRAREVRFDLTEWRQLYGPGTVQLLNLRSGETTPYPCPVTVDGLEARWIIQAVDVDRPGNRGSCELAYIVGDQIAKSERWTTLVLDALGACGCGTTPPWNQSWVDQVLQAGADAQDAAQRAEDAADRAESGGGGGVGTMNHAKLINRDDPDQHPIDAITDLARELAGKTTVADVEMTLYRNMEEISNQEILKIWNNM